MTTHKPLLFSLALAIGAGSFARAHAQEATHMSTRHAVSLDAGLDTAFIARLGYTHRSDLLGPDGRIYARFTLPVVGPDFGDFAVDAGARIHLLGREGWGVQASLGPLLRRAENRLFSSTGLGLRAGLLSGYQSARWGLLFDLGIEQTLTTQLEPSAQYKRTFYAKARSGWYAFSGGLLHAGLRGGVSFGWLELSATLGLSTDLTLQPSPSPFYFTLGTAYSL